MLQGFKGTRLDQIWNTNHRNPGLRVCIWNPRFDDIQSVVMKRWNGPRYDISQFVESASITQNQVFENSTDAVSSRAGFMIRIDEGEGILIGTSRLKINQKMFRDGTPIVVYEGDTRIAKQDWPEVFTGIIRGYPGANTAARGTTKKVRIQAFGRAQTYQRQQIVGVSFDYGSDLGDMAVETALTEMNLNREEIMFGKFDKQVLHSANALTQIGKMEGLNELMKPVKRKPYFDSRGLLVSHDTSFGKPPVWFFREDQIVSISRVQNLAQQVNSVEVTGLDYNLTEVLQSVKPLAEVHTTIGYFDSHYEEDIYYSEDRKRRAKNTYIQDVKRPGFGGSATWTEVNDFHGRLTIDTGYAPQVFGLIALTYAIAASVETFIDYLINTGGSNAGAVYATAKLRVMLVKNAALIACILLMQKIGRWSLVVYGQPFENVYQELRSIAVLKGTKTADVVERKETMHWLSTISDVTDMAKTLLRRELAKSQSYELVLPTVPVLEVDDIIELTARGHGFPRPSKFYITSIDRSFTASSPKGTMKVRGWFCKEELPQ